jgi:hypothetical protein
MQKLVQTFNLIVSLPKDRTHYKRITQARTMIENAQSHVLPYPRSLLRTNTISSLTVLTFSGQIY